ncbi:MAG: DUF222 domain-containing protein [Streptosporangiaceae bacterium]
MFEDVPVEEVAQVLGGHDFALPERATHDQEMGADEVDAIVAYERLIRHAQAGQAAMIEALRNKRRQVVQRQSSLTGELVDDGATIKSLITEVAMARQVSAAGAQTQFSFAVVLASMPQTAGLLRAGVISERVARAAVTECAELSPENAARVDAALAGELPELTAKRAAAAARRLVIGIDPHAAHVRARRERADRYVCARPGPHGTGFLDAKLTAEQTQACWTALDAVARGLRSEGDPRTIGQLMADTLVERVTGQVRADDVGVEVNVLMRPETLLGDEDTPALLAGYGPIPAGLARELTDRSNVWLRRLFTDAHDDTITGRDPTRRRFDGPLGALIRAADQQCGRPWCDCRIVDIDHRHPYAAGGPTTRANGDGYCRRSHTTRHLPGWQVACVDFDGDAPKVLEWTTPTGHRYRSRRPRPLGHGPPVTVPRTGPGESAAEHRLRKHLTALPRPDNATIKIGYRHGTNAA